MGAPSSSRRLHRFTRTERSLHWVHAAAFVVLLVSGLCLYLPSLAELVGRRPLLKTIHVYTALAWIAALLVVVAFGDRRSVRQTIREIDVWDRDDRDWLKRRRSPQGRLNAGQKLNAIATAAFAVLFAVTGVLLWYGERNTRFRFADTILIHDWLMYVSFFLFLGHLYLSLIHPTTRHALNGITRGWVDEQWALEHHRTWAEALGATISAPVPAAAVGGAGAAPLPARATHRIPRLTASRPLRLLIGAVVAFVIVGALVAPVILSDQTSTSQSCTETLRYGSGAYAPRPMPKPPLVESLAIGVGALSGCGTPPSTIDLRSLTGIRPAIATAISTDANSVYVRRGVCPNLAGRALRTCLRSS
jgi:formate dehydrogenase subunit gamma